MPLRKFARTSSKIAVLLLLGGLIWGGWYIYNKGFTRPWRQIVIAEFGKRGIHISIRRLTLDPLRGLVAQEVKVFDPHDDDLVLAFVSDITLDINYANLLQRKSFLNAVDLRDARLTLPIDPARPGSPRLEIRDLNARLLLPPHQAYLSHFEADIHGIHVTASGRIVNPEQYQPGAPQTDEQRQKQAELLGHVVDELRKLQYTAGPARLDVRIEGDAADPQTVFVEATLNGRGIRRGNYHVEQIEAAASYRQGVLSLPRLLIDDGYGALNASGAYSNDSRQVRFELVSSLNPQPLAEVIGQESALRDLVFLSPPHVDLRGEADLSVPDAFRLIGHLAVEDFTVRTVPFQGANADFSIDGSRWYLRDVRLRHASGEVTANLLQLPEEFRATALTTLDPDALLPLTSGKTAAFLNEWDFHDSPRIEVQARGPAPEMDSLTAHGTITLGRTSYRGHPLIRASSKFEVKDRAVTYRDFHVERQEGSGTGTFVYDFGQREVRMEGIRSSVNLHDVAAWIDPKMVKDVTPYRFRAPPNLEIDGVVQFDGGKESDLKIHIDAPAGLDYDFLGKTLAFSNGKALLWFTDRRLRISEVEGSLSGGKVSGVADIALVRDPKFNARIEVERVDFERLTQLYFDYRDSKGRLNGWYEFKGQGGDSRLMEGRGEVKVVGGNVFAIPVLGPFSGIVSNLIPGAGYSVAKNATASFSIADGTITTNDFSVEGRGFLMAGGGKLFFLNDRIDFSIRINAQGAPGALLSPVSKLLEYAAEGSLSEPQWRPKRLPRF